MKAASAASQGRATGERLVVDPIACTGHGMCAELFPEWIELDDWGYPILNSAEVPSELREHAERAVKACPALALRLRRND
ncbi:MAG: ferredoxin [Thermoleophilaceae bacterium]|nr:ferredoxin [Thermoleophilaceae bacterium]